MVKSLPVFTQETKKIVSIQLVHFFLWINCLIEFAGIYILQAFNMSQQEDNIPILLEAYRSKTATAEQEQELMEWVLEADSDEVLKESMRNIWNQFQPQEHSNNVDWNNMFEKIIEKEEGGKLISGHFSWRRIAVAAAVLLFLSVGAYYMIQENNVPGISKLDSPSKNTNQVVAPTGNKALLTLSDGSVIMLENEENGALAVQGNVTVEKTADGQIIYKGSAADIKMNTITVPKGSRPLQLQLADGSKVWLNVESSITYPTAFSGSVRTVEISGEAYFEVAPDPEMPFKVSKGETEVIVLGTHFNINTYTNETAMKVTLLEGSVKVQKGNASGLLKPGQQAVISPNLNSKIQVVKADVTQVMAWKNGLFNFEGAHLDEVMRQLERWYDIEVIYENGIPDIEFVGKMSKNISLDDMLEILKKTKVKFKLVEGRKLLVSN